MLEQRIEDIVKLNDEIGNHVNEILKSSVEFCNAQYNGLKKLADVLEPDNPALGGRLRSIASRFEILASFVANVDSTEIPSGNLPNFMAIRTPLDAIKERLKLARESIVAVPRKDLEALFDSK